MAVNESLNELYGESGGSAAVPAGALGAVASTDQDTDEEYGTIEVLKLRKVKLGRQGENGTQDVVIDCSAWMPELSGCQLMIAAMRPGERKIYVPTVSVSGNVITWPIAAQDVAYAGWGRAEVRGMLNGQIRKSRLFVTYVEPSLEGDGSAEPPTPPDWAQEIIDAVDEAAALVEAATMCAVNAVRFDENQGLKDAQKATARGNIDAASTGSVDDLKSAFDSIENTTAVVDDYNLFDAEDGYASTMRYYENGTEYENSNYYTSPYTEIEANSFYKITSTNAHICLWDSSKNFIEGYLISGTNAKEVNTKSAVYMSLSVPNNAKSTSTIYKVIPVFTDEVERAKKNIELFNSVDILAPNLDYPAGKYSSNGITFDVDNNGNFIANGTATAEAYLTLINSSTSIANYMQKNKAYIGIIDCSNKNISFQVIAYAGSTLKALPLNTTGKQEFSITDDTVTGLWIRLVVKNGTALSNVHGKFAIINAETNEALTDKYKIIYNNGQYFDSIGDMLKNEITDIEIESGYLYYYENGNQYENENYSSTDFISCEKNTMYEYTLYNAHVCLWDSSKNFISGILVTSNNDKNMTFNSGNASYITVSIPTNAIIKARIGKVYPLENKKPYQAGQIHFNIAVNASNMVSTESPSSYADSVLMQNAPGVLILPNTYTASGKAVPLLMICHGSGYAVTDQNWGWNGNADSAFINFVNNFVSAGYAVCDVNGIGTGVQSTWGCPRAVQAYRKLYEYVTKNYNVQDKLNIYGFSMGGLVALNFTANNRDIVKCLAIAAPVTSLYGQVYNWNKGRKETLAAFYNFTLPTGFVFSDGAATAEEIEIWNNNIDKVIGFDPTAKIITYDNKSVLPFDYPPLRVWHAKDDASVPYEPSVNFVQAIRNANNYASIRLMTTGGHGISYGENSYATAEFVMWINRFNQFS